MADYQVFGPSIETLGRVVGEALTASAKDAFRARAGVNFDQPLEAAYPYDVFERALKLTGELVFPALAEEERLHQVGRRMLDSYGETIVGRVLLAMTKVMGPKRTLERSARNLRTANNFTEIRVEWVGERDCRLHINRVVFPPLYQGLLERGLEVSGAKSVRVTTESREGEALTYRATWGA